MMTITIPAWSLPIFIWTVYFLSMTVSHAACLARMNKETRQLHESEFPIAAPEAFVGCALCVIAILLSDLYL